MNYYDSNFNKFLESTLAVDMTPLYYEFTKYLPDNASILDIGCGSGRDLKYFRTCGHRALGLEPNSKLSDYARSYSECNVVENSIEQFDTHNKFDGIWACASLLHLETDALKNSLVKIASLMHLESVFYCSFKHGEFNGERDGRFFNDQTAETFSKIIPEKLTIKKSWITKDLRPDRDDEWLNMMLVGRRPSINY